MKNLEMLLILIVTFLCGFIASELRYAVEFEHNNPSAQTARKILQDVNQAPPMTELASSPPTRDLHNTANNTSVITPRAEPEIFSWERVSHLISLARYDQALSLIQQHLQTYPDSAQASFFLARIYQKQLKPRLAIEAWFRYLNLETDAQKIQQALEHIKQYLTSLAKAPLLSTEDTLWLTNQLDELLNFNSNDGELHLLMASLYMAVDDPYQAQYHALMAVNDPAAKEAAEDVLAQLNGAEAPEELTLPLTRLGNQYVIGVNIEGHSARLLLDTGASISGLARSYAAKYPSLVKSRKPIRLNTANGAVDSYLFTVDHLSLGDLQLNQHILALLPMGNSSEFDGLLGIDILGRYDFIIDQDALLLRLHSRK